MKDVTPQEPNAAPVELRGSKAIAPTDFAVRLFQAGFAGEENTMLSPVSLLYALSMTANGAKGETLSQMEEVLGMQLPELNAYLKAYKDSLSGDLYLANSIWVTQDERFTVRPEFLQCNSDYYGADIYSAPFNAATCEDINAWVKEKTKGMIEEILDEIPEEAVMYLVNALAFEAQWEEIYQETQIREGEFTTEKGEKQKVEMMRSGESYYLESENATGFVKYYEGRDYAFVALLPKEGMSVEEYVKSLDGAALSQLLSQPERADVTVCLPKFESEYSLELSETLEAMGMEDAFHSRSADFSALGSSTEGNIFIGRVLHKTFIAVGEQGTKAGAAAVVEMIDESAAEMPEPKYVTLDRPFVYLIIDTEAKLPLFMGTLMDTN